MVLQKFINVQVIWREGWWCLHKCEGNYVMCAVLAENFYINTSIEDTVNVRIRTLIYLKTVQNWWAQVSRILLRYVLYMILYATECDLTAFVCNFFLLLILLLKLIYYVSYSLLIMNEWSLTVLYLPKFYPHMRKITVVLLP